jgi:ankyrin repeat protein
MACIRSFAVLLTLTGLAYAADVTSRDFYNAIRENDLARLKSITASGADVNLRDARGSTPLMHAAAVGSLDAMKILLKAGADVNAKNGLDTSALIWGALDPAKVRLLVEAGADVNARSRLGRTPLLVAAGRPDSADAVRLLLSKGANSKVADVRGSTPLVEAARVDDIDMLRLLLNAPVNINAGGLVGAAALSLAAGHANLAAVRLLLDKGADVNVANVSELRVKNGLIALSRMTALMSAPESSPEVMEALLKAGANVNARDVRGMTPLMLAVATDSPNPRIVRMLLDHGADTDVKSTDGERALDWAKKFNHPEILGLLGGAPAEAKAVLQPAGEEKSDLRGAIGRGLTVLQSSSTEYFKQSGCVGCHHQNLTGVAVASAQKHGLHVDEATAAEQIRVVKTEFLSQRDGLLQGFFISVDSLALALLQLSEQSYPADEVTDSIAALIASQQSSDGSWKGFLVVRPPLESSDYVRTAFAAGALARYGIPARKAEFDERIARARQWLLQARAELPYERCFQLLGLKWTGAEPQAIERAAAEVRKLQRPDGGWPQIRQLASDAYATGLALYALRQAGESPQSDVYQRGARFLLSSQNPDGTWHVASRAPKLQPYFQSGFPHGHDQWISAAATAWSVAALAEAVEPVQKSAAVTEPPR